MRSFPMVGLAVLAFGAGMMVSGKPEARAQSANEEGATESANQCPCPDPCAGVHAVSIDSYNALWVIKDCAVYRCEARSSRERKNYWECAKQEMVFR